jgi:hypothetical protein
MEAWAGRPIAFKPATFYLEIVSAPLRSRMMRPVSQVTEILTGADVPYSWNVSQADHLAKQGF